MSGQKKNSSKGKDIIVREYIKKTNPYKPLEPLKFDLRGYAACLKEYSISGKDVPEEIISKFQK